MARAEQCKRWNVADPNQLRAAAAFPKRTGRAEAWRVLGTHTYTWTKNWFQKWQISKWLTSFKKRAFSSYLVHFMFLIKTYTMGPSINEVSHLEEGGGSAERWCYSIYSISLFSKIGDKWGQKSQKMGDVIWTAAIEKSRQNNIFLLFHSDFYERKNNLGILSILLFTRHKL